MNEQPGPADTERVPPSVTFASGGLSWTRVRMPRVLSTIAKVFFALGGAGTLLMSLEWIQFGVLAMLFSALAWPLFIVSYILSLTQTAFPAQLEVGSEELVLHASGGAKKIPRSKIASALVVERHMFGGFVPTVEIELTNGNTLVARLADPTAAHAIVRALGFASGGARVHAGLAKPTRRLLHPLLGFVGYVASFAFTATIASFVGHDSDFSSVVAAYPIVALAFYAGLKRFARAPEITVGDDGVLLRLRRGDRFVPRADIAFVGAGAGTSLVISTQKGEQIAVGGTALDDARRMAIAKVIDERAGPSAAAPERFATYERAGRPLAEWREHLARAMTETTYRSNASTVDEAAAVLRSAQATPEQRIGAALALRVAEQPRERIRIAAQGAVDERVREALEAIAEAEDDAPIEKALRRLP